jgi:hypothetical protein
MPRERVELLEPTEINFSKDSGRMAAGHLYPRKIGKGVSLCLCQPLLEIVVEHSILRVETSMILTEFIETIAKSQRCLIGCDPLGLIE